jgi:hypothetical protein
MANAQRAAIAEFLRCPGPEPVGAFARATVEEKAAALQDVAVFAAKLHADALTAFGIAARDDEPVAKRVCCEATPAPQASPAAAADDHERHCEHAAPAALTVADAAPAAKTRSAEDTLAPGDKVVVERDHAYPIFGKVTKVSSGKRSVITVQFYKSTIIEQQCDDGFSWSRTVKTCTFEEAGNDDDDYCDPLPTRQFRWLPAQECYGFCRNSRNTWRVERFQEGKTYVNVRYM